MSKQANTIIGVLLILLALWNPDLSKIRIPDIIAPTPPVVVVDKPTDELLTKAKTVADLIKDKDDRDKGAIYYAEFSTRVYNDATMQNINDILTISGKEYWEGTIKGKYAGLADALRKLTDVQETDSGDTPLSKSQLEEISKRYKALAWALTN